MTRLLFGCGYLGARVAQRWGEAGPAADEPVDSAAGDVVIVTRSADRAASFTEQGFQAIIADVTQPDTLAGLPAAQTVLFAVGFDRAGGGTIEEVYAGGVRNVLAALPASTGRFIYISTTGVYGDASGGWVDENTPPDPQRPGGRASLAAEEALRAHALGSNAVILRLAGIYGPGRIPNLDQLRAGEPIPAPSEGWLNLIHVEDAATAVLAAEAVRFEGGGAPSGDSDPRVYCVSDGHPVVRGDYYREVARLIGAPKPSFATPDPASPRAARAAASRRVSNRRMHDELGVRLTFPSYREGLASILADRDSAF